MLNSISSIDGRYRKHTEPLAEFFSEQAFMRYRVVVETEYLLALAQIPNFKIQITSKSQIQNLGKNFSNEDAEEIKKIEQTTNHDFKAIEYWMGEKLPEYKNWIHFGLTSWDTTNIAYALMIRGALEKVIVPALDNIYNALRVLSGSTTKYAMLARTHGQPASPTTFGKEMAVFASRLGRQLDQLKGCKLTAKLNGATGNYNALVVAYPKIDWVAFSKKFITGFGLEPNLITTQIEPYDNQAELFDLMRRINTILIGFNQDIWRYISDGWLKQKAIEGEIGSSTMPHKINPIYFENSEGNLGIANALFAHFSQKLPISRLQRDLSDSTVMRSIGSAFAYSLIGYCSLQSGLERIDVDAGAMGDALDAHPEVLAEPIQTILRREGMEFPYEKLKEFTRGQKLMLENLRDFINDLKISDEVKKELLALTPSGYLGLASKLSRLPDRAD